MNYPLYYTDDLRLPMYHENPFYQQFSEFISQLLEEDMFENDTERGVVKQVEGKGTKILSIKQAKILEKIVSRYKGVKCKWCMNEIPLNEVIDCLLYNKGFCSYHKYQMDKSD